MTAESDLWRDVQNHLGPYGDIRRVENKLQPWGYPDCNYALRIRNKTTEGHLELKVRAAWPKGEETIIHIPHFTLDQVVWAEERHAVGGRIYMLIRIGDAHLLIDAPVMRDLFDRRLTAECLISAAKVYSTSGFPTRELLEVLAG